MSANRPAGHLRRSSPRVVQHRVARMPDVTEPAVEVDVVVSSDGVPFVHHTYEVDGVGFAFEADGARLRAAGVAPLDEFLGDEPPVPVDVVLLDVRSGFGPELTAHLAVAEVLARTRWLDRAVVVDWDWAQVAELRRRRPDVHVGAATRCRLPGLDAMLTAHPVDYMFLTWDLVRPGDVATCHAHGVAVGTFDGWGPGLAAAAHGLGVDLVLSDTAGDCRRRLDEARRQDRR